MPPRSLLYSLLILVGAAFAYLVGNGSAPLFDRDEPRYAITSRNMLATGDFVVPRQYDVARTAKPPLVYWLQAGAMAALGRTSEFAARLPSSVAMWCVVAMLMYVLFRETDSATALVGTAVFAFSGLTLFLAKAAITDAVLLASTAVSLWCLYRMWRGDRGWGVFLAYGVATGLGGLTKGPVVLGVQGATLGALVLLRLIDRRYPANAPWQTFDFPPRDRPAGAPVWVKGLVAAGLVVAIVLPWVILVEQRTWATEGRSFLYKAISNDVVKRSTRGVDGQARPPGFYLLTVFGTFYPWSLLLPGTLVIAWKNRHRPLTRFCIAAAVGPWLMFEAVTSKMVHWFLPVFLPLSVLTGDAVVRCWRGKYADFSQKPFKVAAGVWAGITVVIGLAPWGLVWAVPGTPWWTAAAVTAWGVAMAAVGFVLVARGKLLHAVGAMAGMMAVLFPLAFGAVVPNWGFARLGKDVGTDLRELGATGPGSVVMADGVVSKDGFKEPSVAFYQGGTIREAPPAALTTRPALGWAVILQEDFDALPEETRAAWEVVGSRRGIAYANERREVEVLIVRKR